MQSLPRSLFVFAFCVPLAFILGIVLATPLDRNSMMMVGAGFFLLLTPIFLTSHQAFLIISCNAYINAFFLPGQPQLWLIAAVASCFFAVLTRTLNRGKMVFLNVPSITWALIALFVITFVTAQATGGVGTRAFGSGQFGGRRYIYLWGAIAAYFAISTFPIAAEKRRLYTGLYFLSGVTSMVSNLTIALGPTFYFLFLLFPPELAISQALSDEQFSITRLAGLGPAAMAVWAYLLFRYGVRGCLSLRHFWRPLVLLAALYAGLHSGFRSVLVFCALLFVVLFFLEGLHKTKYLAILLVVGTVVGAMILPVANRLPLSVQRCLTVFPIDLDRSAIDDARNSSQWRLDMWRAIIPDISKYFWLGKGFAIDPKDMYFANEGMRRGVATGFEGAIVAGDYHSGPLTLIIPFGIWGVLAFLWFVAASLRVLWLNYKNSELEMKTVNTFLLGFFFAKFVFYCFVYGSFYIDMLFFATTVALSISVNRGVLKVPQQTVPEVAPEPVRPSLPLRLPPRGGFQPA